jgi:hypothetical protein
VETALYDQLQETSQHRAGGDALGGAPDVLCRLIDAHHFDQSLLRLTLPATTDRPEMQVEPRTLVCALWL